METFEQKNTRMAFERLKLARTKYSLEQIAEKYKCKKQRISELEMLFHNKNYRPHPTTIYKLNKSLDELNIPKGE